MAELDDAVALLLRNDLQSADFNSKRVLYRVDLNVPVIGGRVADDARLRSILPTLQLLLQKGGRVVLCSHLGRPDPATQTAEEMREFSLAPVAELLQQQLGRDVFTGLAADCVGSAAEAAVAALQPGQVSPLSDQYCLDVAVDAHVIVFLLSKSCMRLLHCCCGLQLC
jgi:phosphoglycerate kinase